VALPSSITDGGVSHTFERSDGAWKYAAESDLPLDSKKVEDLLLRVRDLRTERYIRYANAEGALTLGLDQPERMISLVFKDGTKTVLDVSPQGGGAGAPPGRVASIEGIPGVFVLSNETLSRVSVSLDELE